MPEHDGDDGDQRERPEPGVDGRAQGDDLGDQPDDARRQAGEHEQREGQRPTGQPVAAQQAAGALERAGPHDGDRGERDEGGHGVHEHVGG